MRLDTAEDRSIDHLHVAGQKGGHARGRARNHLEADVLPLRLRAPVGIVALEHHAVAGHVLGEAVRPGADHQLAGVEVLRLRRLGDGLRQDHDRAEIVRQQRMRLVGLQSQRVLVGRLDVDDRPHEEGERSRAVGHVGHALEGGDHIIGRELLAIVELHALTQLDLPFEIVERLPRFRQARLHALAFVLPDQRLEDVAVQAVVRRQVMEVRIERRHRRRQADRQVGRLHGGGQQQREKGRA